MKKWKGWILLFWGSIPAIIKNEYSKNQICLSDKARNLDYNVVNQCNKG